MKVITKLLMFTILISLFFGMFFHNESFAVPDYGEPGSYNTAFSIELVCESLENYEVEVYGDYGYETRVYSEDILDEDFYVKIASLVDMGETIETSSFGVLNYVGTEEIIGRHCYIYTADITDKTIFDNKIIEDLRYPEYNFKFYYEISLKDAKYINDLNININTENKYYTGEEIETSISLKDGEYILEEGIDYTVFYNDNILTGTAKVTVTGMGNYYGTTSKEFEIIAKELSKYVEVIVDTEDKQYTEFAIRPSVVVKAGEELLKEGTDYTLQYQNNIYIGTATVKIIGKGIYTGTITESFKIVPKDISTLSKIRVDTYMQEYNGKMKETIIELYNATKLSLGKDYTVEYQDNINVGMATVTIKGIGNYTGTIIETFEICAKQLSSSGLIIDKSSKMYTGQPITTTVTVKDGSKILELERDYTIQYQDNIKVGGVTVKVQGKGNYSGEIFDYFNIIARDLNTLTEIVVDTESKVYNGKEINSQVSILKYGDIILEELKDYNVEYKDNINVGTATVILTGTGSYSGLITKTFEIIPKDISTLTNIIINPCYEAYTGYPINVFGYIKDGDIELSEGWDYIIEYDNNINPGTATAIIKGKNNYKGEILKTYEIEKKDINKLIINVNANNYIYTGEAIEPSVEIIYDDKTLILNEDYEVSYENNTNVGTATAKISGIGNYKGTIEKTFQILSNQIFESGYYKYKFLTDGTIEIVAYTGKERDVNIPSKIDGFDVTSIGKKAFYNTWIHTLVIPSTIINIGESAFSSCYSLAEIQFNEGLKNIGDSAFIFCNSLLSIELPNSVNVLGNGVFSYCAYLEKVKLSNNIKVIPYGAFDGCEHLLFVEVPDSVIKIEKNAFSSGDLKHVIISSSTNQIDEEAFGDITHQLTIYGQQNSYIQEYANLNTINFKDINNFNKEETYRTYEVKKRREGYVVIDTDSFSDIYCGAYWEIEDTSIAKITESKNATEKNGLSYSVFISSYIEGVSVGTTKLFLKAKDGTIIKTYKLDVEVVLTQLANDFIVSGIVYEKEYTGKEITYDVNVKTFYYEPLIKDVDYTVTYLNNVNVGTATIIIKGIDTYAGEITKTFDITPRNIGDIDIKLDNNAKVYTGEEIYTDITAKFGDIQLKNNVDYKLEYRHNINVGIAKVFITGIGNYTATREYSFKIIDIDSHFTDISKDMWYYNAVRYTYVRGMIKGMTETTFAPNKDLTRGMLVTILWRMEGSKKVTQNQFTDVAENMWYANAVNWAANNRIVSGYGNGKFGPNDKITREQLAVMLRNYAIYKKKDVSARTDLSKFVDNKYISSYAKDAVSWAVANKVISGKLERTKLDPRGKATRAEVAAMLYNYCNNIK